MKTLISTALAGALAVLPLAAQAAGAKRTHPAPRGQFRAVQPAPPAAPAPNSPYGNSANSPDGSNSATNNAIGRSSGGMT